MATRNVGKKSVRKVTFMNPSSSDPGVVTTPIGSYEAVKSNPAARIHYEISYASGGNPDPAGQRVASALAAAMNSIKPARGG